MPVSVILMPPIAQIYHLRLVFRGLLPLFWYSLDSSLADIVIFFFLLKSVRLSALKVLKLDSCEGITSASMAAIAHSYSLEV